MSSISIILPVYNGIKYLPDAIESVLKQSYEDFDFLIIDDCSTDNSWEYLSSLKDGRIKLFKNESNKGLFYNLNFLIKQSNTPLIKLWSQDDVMYSECIKKIISFHQQYPQVGFSYTERDYIDGDGELIFKNIIDNTPSLVSSELHTRIAFFTGSIAGNIANVTLTRAALEKVGLFNEGMKISGDFDMWVRIAEYYPIGFLREPLVQLRDHKGQLSRQEQYYIHHLEEDVIVYNYLLNYSSEKQKNEGRIMLRNRKLLFYYTLMLKALFKGHVKIAYRFCKALNRFDNVIVLSGFFIRNRILKKKQLGLFSAEELIQYKYQFQGSAIEKTAGISKPLPFVSVLMTAYNREKYIGEAIESVLSSSYTNFELLIVDDCSSDGTVSIMRLFEKKDKRIKVFVNDTNLGQFQNRNLVNSYAKGKYIKFVDSDDCIFPSTLQIMVEGMENYPEAAMGICQETNDEKESLPVLVYPQTIFQQHFYGKGILKYGPTGTIIKRDIFNKLGGFSYKRYIADTEFWLKLSAAYPIIKFQPGLVFWRVHSEQEFYYGNASHSYIEDAYKTYINALMYKNCPLEKKDIKLITRRLRWKQARDILSLAFKKSRLSLAFNIYKKSDLNFWQLLTGLVPYKIIKFRF